MNYTEDQIAQFEGLINRALGKPSALTQGLHAAFAWKIRELEKRLERYEQQESEFLKLVSSIGPCEVVQPWSDETISITLPNQSLTKGEANK